MFKFLSYTIELFDKNTLYPNPSSGIVNIAIPMAANEMPLEVYNYNGQLISKGTYKVHYGKVQLDLTNYPTGTYIVKILGDNPVSFTLIRE